MIIYYYDIENDIIIYTLDNNHFYKRERNIEEELNQYEINNLDENFRLSLLPCGITTDNIKIDNYNIGEGIVDHYHTDDIFIKLNNKLYIAGRKTDLINHSSLPYLDNKTTDLFNKRCTTFTKDGDIYLAIKYDLSYKERGSYFRNLITLSKDVENQVKQKYPIIKDVIFIPESLFPLSDNLKKSRRKELLPLLEKYEEIRYRLNNYEECLANHLNDVFQRELNYIPNYKINDEKNIIIPCDQINEQQLIDLLNPLSIVAIEKKETENSYYIYYDDFYFFGIGKSRQYSERYMERYREFSKYELFLDKLKADNVHYTLEMKSKTLESKKIDSIIIKAAVGIDKNGNTYIYHYNAGPNPNEEIQIVKALFKDIPFEEKHFYVFVDVNDYTPRLPELIKIDSENNICSDDKFDIAIAKAYLYSKEYGSIHHLIKK